MIGGIAPDLMNVFSSSPCSCCRGRRRRTVKAIEEQLSAIQLLTPDEVHVGDGFVEKKKEKRSPI